jgi:amino acid transporter
VGPHSTRTVNDGRSESAAAALPRVVTRWDLTCQTINIIVGSSVFVLPGLLLADMGGWAPLAVLATGAGVFCILLSFAEAAGRYAQPGGPYRYAGDAFGEYVGVQLALLYWVVRATASAAVANVFVIYFAELWPPASEPLWRAVLLTIVVAASGWVNVRGTRQTAAMVNVFTVAKLLPVAVLCAAGVFFISSDNLSGTPLPPLSTWGRAVLLWVFAFGGFEATMIPAGEMRDPKRDGPQALLTALLIVTVVYAVVQLVVAGTISGDASERPVGQAAGLALGPAGPTFVAIGVLLATSGHIGGSILSASRITFAIAANGELPSALARVSPRFRTPDVSIVLFTLLLWVLAVSGSFVWNAAISAVARLLVYVVTSLAVLRLRRDGPSAFPVPAPVHVAAIVFCAWLFTHQTAREAIAVGGVIAAGSVLWWVYRTFRRRPQAQLQ